MSNYFIVGASSGIGKAIAEDLAKAGHHVYGTFNKKQCGDQENLNYHFLDVMSENFDLSFLPEKIDGLAYCPGSIVLKPFHRIKADDFVSDYQLQTIGAIKTIQAVLPKLKDSGNASIVLFSTLAVQTGLNFHSMVASSKGAIEGLSRALAAEFAPSIRVNCIAPSLTDTPLAASLLNTEEKKLANAQRHPLKRVGSAEDISNLACFLLSEKSSWMTGQILHLDGGMSALK